MNTFYRYFLHICKVLLNIVQILAHKITNYYYYYYMTQAGHEHMTKCIRLHGSHQHTTHCITEAD